MRKSKDYYKAIILLVVIAFSSALNSQDNLLNANSFINSSISDNISLNAGVNFRKLR